MSEDHLEAKLHWAASRALGGGVRYAGFVPVMETVSGEVVWKGAVSIFEGSKGRVYAWADERGEEVQYLAVLHQPPVDSPFAAVRSWLDSKRGGDSWRP